MDLLRRWSDEGGDVPTLLVHQGSPEKGEEFLSKRWPEARAVSDPDRRLYDAFGLDRGSLGQLFGLPVWRRAVGAARHGVGLSRPVGDPFLLGGAFLVRGNRVLESRPAADASTVPDLEGLAEAARGA